MKWILLLRFTIPDALLRTCWLSFVLYSKQQLVCLPAWSTSTIEHVRGNIWEYFSVKTNHTRPSALLCVQYTQDTSFIVIEMLDYVHKSLAICSYVCSYKIQYQRAFPSCLSSSQVKSWYEQAFLPSLVYICLYKRKRDVDLETKGMP